MKKRILIADNHEIIRQGIRVLAEPNHIVCGEAADGREAYEKTLELRPDLVILDVSMPVMNGLDAARWIRAARPEIKILLLSNHDSEHLAEEAKAAGADASISKETLVRDFARAIAGLLGESAT